MKKSNYMKTKEFGLTAAFIVIMIAFCAIMAGLAAGAETICAVGFVVIVAAMLYSPLNVFVLQRLWKDK